MNTVTVDQLLTYPVKGLTGESREQVMLTTGHGILGDRGFALMFVDAESITTSETEVPWMSKKHFAVQNDWPSLAALDCCYDHQTCQLIIRYQQKTLVQADMTTTEGRKHVSAFFTGYIAALEPTPEARHPQKMRLTLVGDCDGHTRYPDREPVHLSLISQGTLDQLSAVTGTPITSARFRPNVVVRGMAPWQEFELVGQRIRLGAATLEITARIGRCANIEVDPETGLRDTALLEVLQQKYGHLQAGVLGKVISSGVVKQGDRLQIGELERMSQS